MQPFPNVSKHGGSTQQLGISEGPVPQQAMPVEHNVTLQAHSRHHDVAGTTVCNANIPKGLLAALIAAPTVTLLL